MHHHHGTCPRCDERATSHVVTLLTLLLMLVAAVLARGEIAHTRYCSSACVDAVDTDAQHVLE